jgi:hypothetical protein
MAGINNVDRVASVPLLYGIIYNYVNTSSIWVRGWPVCKCMGLVSKGWYKYYQNHKTGANFLLRIEVSSMQQPTKVIKEVMHEWHIGRQITHVQLTEWEIDLKISKPGDEDGRQLALVYALLPHWGGLQHLDVHFTFHGQESELDSFFSLEVEPRSPNDGAEFTGFQCPEGMDVNIWSIMPRVIISKTETSRRLQNLKYLRVGPISLTPYVVEGFVLGMQGEVRGVHGFEYQRKWPTVERNRMVNIKDLTVVIHGYGDFRKISTFMEASFCQNHACAQNCREVLDEYAKRNAQEFCVWREYSQTYDIVLAKWTGEWEEVTTGWGGPTSVPLPAAPLLPCVKQHFEWSYEDVTGDHERESATDVPVYFCEIIIFLKGIKTIKTV